MQNFYITPGVYPQELDLSGRANPISTTIMASAFPSKRGSLQDIFINDESDFVDTFGPNDYQWTFAHAMIRATLRKAQGGWFRRVVKNARHSGLVISNDVVGVQGAATYYTPFPAGRFEGYATGGQEYQQIILAGPLVTGNTIAATLTSDNAATTTITQIFTTDHDTTMRLFTNAINLALTTSPFVGAGKVAGGAALIDPGSSVTDSRIIKVISPEDTAVVISALGITGGSTQTTGSIQTHPWLFEVWAENPGTWGNDIGFKVINVDNGVNQRQQLAFASAITSGGSFRSDIILNGVRTSIGPVAFATDMPTTAQNIVNAFLTALGTGSDGWVVTGSSGLQIVIVSPIDGPATLTIVSPAVTGGGAPAVTVTETLAGIDNDDTFELWVYDRSKNVNNPIEKHVVSLTKQLDGFGRQLFIEDAINTSGSRSKLIRVRTNTLNSSGRLTNVPLEGTAIQYLAGGDNGSLPSNSDIAAQWLDSFRSRRKRPVRLLINAGHSSPTVQQRMDSIAQSRWDCFCILDMPSDKQDAADAVDQRKNVLNLNSNYSAIYAPDLLVIDEVTNSPYYLPPSGHVAAQFAYNDAVAAEWFSPAGLNRGLVTEIQGLRVEYEEADLALLISNQINPIVKEPGKGYVIKSAETLQSKASALSNINVRRLLITIEVTLVEALDYAVHEPNDAFTRFLVVQIATNFLQPIKIGRGLYDYAVVSDDRNTKDYHIDMGQLNVDVYLKPVLPVKFIQLTSIITKTGAFFQETIAALTGGSV